jgi:hypothetical protein
MGTAFAPPYANIYVFRNEIIALKQFIDSHPSVLIARFFRFIDDILTFIICDSIDQVNEFISVLNRINSNLKYSFESSQTNIHFLDVNISINHLMHRLETSLFVKPSNTFQYLYHSSAHPHHTIDSIATGLSNRIVRICSSNITRWNEFFNLYIRLTNRGHNPANILDKILRFRSINRHTLFSNLDREEFEGNHYNIIVPFHPQIPSIRNLLNPPPSLEDPGSSNMAQHKKFPMGSSIVTHVFSIFLIKKRFSENYKGF